MSIPAPVTSQQPARPEYRRARTLREAYDELQVRESVQGHRDNGKGATSAPGPEASKRDLLRQRHE